MPRQCFLYTTDNDLLMPYSSLLQDLKFIFNAFWTLLLSLANVFRMVAVKGVGVEKRESCIFL